MSKKQYRDRIRKAKLETLDDLCKTFSEWVQGEYHHKRHKLIWLTVDGKLPMTKSKD